MAPAFRRSSLPLIAVALIVMSATSTYAAGTILKVSLWGDMTGTMPDNLGMAMGKSKDAMQGANPKMGVTINQRTIKAGPATFEVKNNSEKTIHEMLVVPIKDTSTPLPYLKNENRLDEDKIHSLGEVSETDPGKSGTLKVDLKPGKYLLLCNVPGHYMAGMWTLLTVRP